MIREHGNMWSIWNETDYFCITTNSFVRQDGQLVMGRGIARRLSEKQTQVARLFGERMEHLGQYGIKVITIPNSPTLVAFQVKRHWIDIADVRLISHAAHKLGLLALAEPEKRFDLNFPGIGNGKLSEKIVLPHIIGMPDNVHVWTYN